VRQGAVRRLERTVIVTNAGEATNTMPHIRDKTTDLRHCKIIESVSHEGCSQRGSGE